MNQTCKATWPIVKVFYQRLADATHYPLHRWHRQHGHLWQGDIREGNGEGMTLVYHQALILPYVGTFGHPQHWMDPARPIPRIHLDHCETNPPRSMLTALSHWPIVRFERFPNKLELTCTLDELGDFAAWIADWAHARAKGRPDLLPPPPHPLEGNPNTAAADYLWTVAADAEYQPHRARQQALLERTSKGVR